MGVASQKLREILFTALAGSFCPLEFCYRKKPTAKLCHSFNDYRPFHSSNFTALACLVVKADSYVLFS
jgi:hypothetical protein